MNETEFHRLPEEVGKSIPAGENICWEGKPDWKSFGYHSFGIKYLIFYFVISAFYAVSQLELAFSFSSFLVRYIPFVISGVIAGIILYLLAYLIASHTCYVITEKRVVIRTGVALVFLLNIPLNKVVSIDKQSLTRGRGNLSFKSQFKKRIPYFSCWPSVKNGSFLEPVPAFRSVANVEEVGKIVSEMAESNRPLEKKSIKVVNSGVAA